DPFFFVRRIRHGRIAEQRACRYSERTLQISTGIERQLITAALPNAAARLQCWPIVPTSSDPTPMPVSNAHTIEPNVRARRLGSVFVSMNDANEGYIHPKPTPKMIAERTICPRVCANASTTNANGMMQSAV